MEKPDKTLPQTGDQGQYHCDKSFYSTYTWYDACDLPSQNT